MVGGVTCPVCILALGSFCREFAGFFRVFDGLITSAMEGKWQPAYFLFGYLTVGKIPQSYEQWAEGAQIKSTWMDEYMAAWKQTKHGHLFDRRLWIVLWLSEGWRSEGHVHLTSEFI